MVACEAARGGIVTDGTDPPVLLLLLVVVIAVVASLGPANEVHAAAALDEEGVVFARTDRGRVASRGAADGSSLSGNNPFSLESLAVDACLSSWFEPLMRGKIPP